MPTIAFVTCEPFGHIRADGFAPDDALAIADLERVGVHVSAVRWDDPSAAWEHFDLVIVRSPWDYFRRLPEFLAWLDHLERVGARVHNPVRVIRDNLDKRYLLDLAQRGVPVTPTVHVPRGAAPELAVVLAQRGWDEAVVKPAVSAAAFETWRVAVAGADAAQARFAALVAERDVLIQPFLAEIAEGGEWSLVFFTGRYSHALRKFPAPGDFRVQQYHGGSLQGAVAPPELIAEATAILAQASGPLLYARVDGVQTRDGFRVMELELIEPELFLRTDPAAPERFALAVQEVLATKPADANGMAP